MDHLDIVCLQNREETLWLNPELSSVQPASVMNGYKFIHVKAAQNRFMRFLPYIASAFPEKFSELQRVSSAPLTQDEAAGEQPPEEEKGEDSRNEVWETAH